MDDNTYFLMYRKIRDWEWRSDLKVLSVFIECLCSASYKEKSYRGEIIKAGQFTTSFNNLAQRSHVSVKSLRTALDKLKSTNDLAIESNRQRTKITVLNWESYQIGAHKRANDGYNEGQTKGKQRASNKKGNKGNKGNKYIVQIEELYKNYYPRKEGKTRGVKKLCSEIKNQQDLENLQTAIKNYAQHVKSQEKQYIKIFSTFAGDWRDYVDFKPQENQQGPNWEKLRQEYENGEWR